MNKRPRFGYDFACVAAVVIWLAAVCGACVYMMASSPSDGALQAAKASAAPKGQ